jgi:hypothetical protein
MHLNRVAWMQHRNRSKERSCDKITGIGDDKYSQGYYAWKKKIAMVVHTVSP